MISWIKKNIYSVLLVIQLISFVLMQIVKDLLEFFNYSYSKQVGLLGGLFLWIVVYNSLLWYIIRNLSKSKVLNYGILLLLAMELIFLILGNTPALTIEDDHRIIFIMITHSIALILDFIFFLYVAKDIFHCEVITLDKLMGAGAVFLMLGLVFANVFELITTLKPGSLGVYFVPGWDNYKECLYYSFNILAGLDNIYQNPHHVIRQTAIFESLLGQIYIIIFVGRLLAKPILQAKTKE
jgi:hypothetical protein